jgi:predicted dienelactone hydrolase
MSLGIPIRHRHGRADPVRRRAALLSAAMVALALPIAVAGPATALPSPPPRSSTAQFTLPESTGHQLVGTTTLHLVDASRPDPWVPTQHVRELAVQLWYPASTVAGYPRTSWLTPDTARAYEKANNLPVLDWPITDGHLSAPVHQRPGGWPVVLYSPGMGGQRQETTAVVEDLASHGYIVATIDAVHDSGVVVLPGGRVETTAIPELTDDNELAVTTKMVVSRAADTGFVLDQLAAISRGGNPDREHRPLPRGLRGALDLDHVGMFGHSDGGSTTAHAMHVDPRIRAGVDMDGTLWTPEAVAGSDRPLLLFGRQDLDSFEARTWSEFRTNQRGPMLQLSLTGSAHGTFSDLAVLGPQAAPILGIPAENVTAAFGTINGVRAVAVIRAYLNAFFGRYLGHHASPLLTGPSARFPEVQFVS